MSLLMTFIQSPEHKSISWFPAKIFAKFAWFSKVESLNCDWFVGGGNFNDITSCSVFPPSLM
uniref:Uncharacterized protein n=1 Tax=Ciona intestinalis TaxID=7719 RepID=H2Y312_CIOIN